MWDDDAKKYGYTVNGNLGKDVIAVNETQRLSNGTLTGHVATVYNYDSTYVYVWEMNWGVPGLKQKRYRHGYFTKFIYPKAQPKLYGISPQPMRSSSDAAYWLSGENLNRVTRLEITFPNGGKGSLSGSQIPYKDYWNLQMIIWLGGSGRWVVNAITDQNIESYGMPFNVQ